MKYDFVEIGTCDFETLLQTTVGLKGISVEPLKLYLDNLPDNDNVIKVNCAISNQDSETDIWWVDPRDITIHNLPDWFRGCNSIGKPHQSVYAELQSRDMLYLYKRERIQCLSWKTFIATYDIKNIDFLKIDTEGHDYIIVNDILDYGKVYPNKIVFESNVLSPQDEIQKTVQRLRDVGYIVISWTDCDIHVLKTNSLV